MKIFFTAILLWITIAVSGQPRARSEFFIQIKDPGSYSVNVGEDACRSTKGKFRFFELLSGRNKISIEVNGRLLVREELDLTPGYRTVATFSRTSGLKVQSRLPIYRSGQYSLDDWDGSLLPEPRPQYEQPERPGRGMPAADFARLKRLVEKESFDRQRVNLLKVSLKSNEVSVDQLSVLLKFLSFDDAKLEMIKYAYDRVVDPHELYRLVSALDHLSSKEKLEDFLKVAAGNRSNSARPQRQFSGMDPVSFKELKELVKTESFDSGRQKVINLGVKSNVLSVDQLADLLALLSKDDVKLEIAINSYRRVADPGNLYRLRECLTFASNKDKFDSFLLGI